MSKFTLKINERKPGNPSSKSTKGPRVFSYYCFSRTHPINPPAQDIPPLIVHCKQNKRWGFGIFGIAIFCQWWRWTLLHTGWDGEEIQGTWGWTKIRWDKTVDERHPGILDLRWTNMRWDDIINPEGCLTKTQESCSRIFDLYHQGLQQRTYDVYWLGCEHFLPRFQWPVRSLTLFLFTFIFLLASWERRQLASYISTIHTVEKSCMWYIYQHLP